MSALPDLAGLTLGGLIFTSMVISLSGVIVPGPVLAVTITRSARQGASTGPLVILGHFLAEGLLLAALLAGLGPFLTRPLVSGLIGGGGALILLWMSISMLRSLPNLDRIETGAAGIGNDPAPEGERLGTVRDGFLLSLANPYFPLWWATVGLSLVTASLELGWGWWGLVFFYAAHLATDLAWYCMVSLSVAKGGRFLSPRIHQLITGACALCLIFFSVFFAIFGWSRLAASS